MEKYKNSINVEGGFLFRGGWNFSKSVSMGPTFIRKMRVLTLHCNKIRPFSNEINKRGGWISFCGFFKIGKCGLHDY